VSVHSLTNLSAADSSGGTWTLHQGIGPTGELVFSQDMPSSRGDSALREHTQNVEKSVIQR